MNGVLERWREDWEIEIRLVFIFVEFQAQTAAGSCSPATRRKRMKAVMWQQRLILIIICFSISSGTLHSFAQKCFSNRLPSSFSCHCAMQPHPSNHIVSLFPNLPYSYLSWSVVLTILSLFAVTIECVRRLWTGLSHLTKYRLKKPQITHTLSHL